MHTKIQNIRYAVVSISDSRYMEKLRGLTVEDGSGILLRDELNAEIYELIPDNPKMIKGLIEHIIDYSDVECIVLTGGTGLSNRDNTSEVVNELYDKKLEGFSIVFHKLSYDEVQFSTILSRASAGIYNKKLIYSLPGSINACKTGLKIIKQESGHILGHIE
ncbi:MogA/MoaB family molybdenum cofactor biosynthesis protein [Methanococcus voltae]|uniref:Molybdenum cofactor biosynthesis protein B n=2 Tax=Methanococcus voltae TaxID=2188 RepID=A0A8J7USI9_METVO|nr:MogA/MoaB family molybdenum cofactor biosynthesis protein [Methanococcus voltae]MBP2172888.1 molybdenum cofactor biosynthesis protein B [Methanococcus voltae]MBP2201702.1 molybdenum cofactor biosynthesis protein B [Methanococcus voltae]MCS3922490.1 molybdenum cofactor biosynthesis protein B [Methanococcus voltae PS]